MGRLLLHFSITIMFIYKSGLVICYIVDKAVKASGTLVVYVVYRKGIENGNYQNNF